MEKIEIVVSYLQSNQFVANLVGLPIMVVLNIILGLSMANFKKEFDWEKFNLGLKKGLAVYFSIAVLSGLAQFIKIADIDLIPTMSIIVYGVLGVYTVQVVDKIMKILGYNKSEIE